MITIGILHEQINLELETIEDYLRTLRCCDDDEIRELYEHIIDEEFDHVEELIKIGNMTKFKDDEVWQYVKDISLQKWTELDYKSKHLPKIER